MNNFEYDKVEVALVDVDSGAIESIKGIMQGKGFRKFKQGADIPSLIEMVKSGSPDIIIMGGKFKGGGVPKFINMVRHNLFYGNPFVPIVVMTWNPTPELANELIDAGVDDLVPMPISASHLMKRITNLIDNRPPFCVTTDYIGPDRRNDSKRGSDIPRIEVPNVLRAKATGDKLLPADIRNQVFDALAEVNLQKLERHSFQIAWLVDKSIGKLLMGTVDDEVSAYMNKLYRVAKDISKRLVGTKFSHISELCGSIIQVSGSIIENKSNFSPKDVQLLVPLSKAIKNSFDPNLDQAAVASDIAAVISATNA